MTKVIDNAIKVITKPVLIKCCPNLKLYLSFFISISCSIVFCRKRRAADEHVAGFGLNAMDVIRRDPSDQLAGSDTACGYSLIDAQHFDFLLASGTVSKRSFLAHSPQNEIGRASCRER